MDRFSRENTCTICHDYGSSECGCPSDAQSRIAELEAEVARLREALEVFADAHDGRRRSDIWGSVCFKQEALKAAKEALRSAR